MAQLAAFGVVDEFDDELAEIEQRIKQAQSDRERLSELRAKGGSIDEVVEIIERAREGLLRLMEIDPAHRAEIKAALDTSAARIRKMVREHNRAVRKQRMKENEHA